MKTQMKLHIEKLPGDWRPLRWIVKGPADEKQTFSTRANARRFANLRRNSHSQAEAIEVFVRLSF